MTEPSQYFKGRTVQEQMNEVIGYVDARTTEVATNVATAKATEVLQPAEDAKVAAIAAQEAAEDAQDAAESARDTTLAALPTIQQDITDLKAEDVALDGRLDTVELKVQTAEGNIVTIQGQIVALQTADGQNVKIAAINNYAVGLTGNQKALGYKNGLWVGYKYTNPTAVTAGKWLRYMAIPTRYTLTMTEIIGTVGNNGLCYAKAITSGTGGFNRIFPIANQPGNSDIKVVCTINQTTNKMEFWIYIPVANNVNGMDFYNTYTDDVSVTQVEYFNTEHDSLPSDGYTTPVYILGSA